MNGTVGSPHCVSGMYKMPLQVVFGDIWGPVFTCCKHRIYTGKRERLICSTHQNYDLVPAMAGEVLFLVAIIAVFVTLLLCYFIAL